MGHHHRKFIKRELKKRLRNLNVNVRDKINRINKEIIPDESKVPEMKKVYLEAKSKDKLLLLDLDGCLAEYRVPSKSNRKIRFRPHFEKFIAEMSIHCDLFLYSFSKTYRIQCLWKRYFANHFSGVFGTKYAFEKRKSLRAFGDITSHMALLDDSEDVVHYDSQDKVILIKRWFGDSEDEELLIAEQKLKKLLEINS